MLEKHEYDSFAERADGRTDSGEDLNDPAAHTDLGSAEIDTTEAVDVGNARVQL